MQRKHCAVHVKDRRLKITLIVIVRLIDLKEPGPEDPVGLLLCYRLFYPAEFWEGSTDVILTLQKSPCVPVSQHGV